MGININLNNLAKQKHIPLQDQLLHNLSRKINKIYTVCKEIFMKNMNT